MFWVGFTAAKRLERQPARAIIENLGSSRTSSVTQFPSLKNEVNGSTDLLGLLSGVNKIMQIVLGFSTDQRRGQVCVQ